MQVRNSTRRWGAVTKLLHWLVVALVITQFVLANAAERLPLGGAKLALLARHKSVGITILGLAVLRLLWRIGQPVPALPASLPRWQRGLAHGTHHLLYALLFAMPLTGWLMSSAKNYPVSWFGLAQLPDLVDASESTFAAMQATHGLLAGLLAATAALHLAGALKHHFVDRDDVLKRMLPFVRAAWPVLALPATLWLAAPGASAATQARAATTVSAATAPAPRATASSATTPPATIPRAAATAGRQRLLLDPAHSTLEFRFKQAGALTRGRFTRFTAQLDWAAAGARTGASPGATPGALEVDIEVASLDTADRDRDTTLRGAELFASERFPHASFASSAIVPGRAPGSWVARGTLRIRDRSREVALPLTLERSREAGRGVASLRGETTIRRLDYGVGQGEWQSTEWVGDEVVVHWDLRLLETP